MNVVLLTALGVGGATVLGAVLGVLCKDFSRRFSVYVLAFASGIMLAASVIALILPSLENGGKYGVIITIIGIFAGALCLNVIDKVLMRLGKYSEKPTECTADPKSVLLFVSAIAVHNLPEGLAAGVGFGTGDFSSALLIAGGIALQNIPEGMVIIAPMLSLGIKPQRAFIIAALTGFVEVVGTFIGYFAVSLTGAILPFTLAFAGGTMLYIISGEIIPDVCSQSSRNKVAYSILAGFAFMLIFDALL